MVGSCLLNVMSFTPPGDVIALSGEKLSQSLLPSIFPPYEMLMLQQQTSQNVKCLPFLDAVIHQNSALRDTFSLPSFAECCALLQKKKLALYQITMPSLLRPERTVVESEVTVRQLRSHGVPRYTLTSCMQPSDGNGNWPWLPCWAFISI